MSVFIWILVFTIKGSPFFVQFEDDIKFINEQPDKAVEELIARNPVFYKKTLFRAFLHYSGKELEEMSMDEYRDCDIMLNQVLKLIHAPYINHENN